MDIEMQSARQGVTHQGVRYVLAFGLVLAVFSGVAFVVFGV
jgi:hypothetical protein